MAYSDMDTLLTNIQTALVGNTTLDTWCDTNYSKAVKVFIGTDMREPPGESDDPCVGLYPARQTSGYGEEAITKTICVSCEVFNDDKTNATNGTTGATSTIYDGVTELEQFRQAVLTVVKGMSDSDRGGRIDKVDTVYEVVAFFPQFTCDMFMEIVEDLYQGSDPIV